MKTRLYFNDYALFAEAWIALGFARCRLVCISFKKIMAQNEQTNCRTGHDQMQLHNISIAIDRAGRYSPWRTKCFEKALAARRMLRRRKLCSVIYFGVSHHNQKIIAHAWTDCLETRITGGQDTRQYKVIAVFKN